MSQFQLPKFSLALNVTHDATPRTDRTACSVVLLSFFAARYIALFVFTARRNVIFLAFSALTAENMTF